MPETITIHFEGHDVGVQYHPETSEAVLGDEMIAMEMGLQVLAAQAVEQRRRNGIPVPAVLIAIAQAHTFHDLL